jgi:hypothetical protein
MLKITRRDFLGIAGTSIGGVYLGGVDHQTASRFALQILLLTRGRSVKSLGFLRKSI